MTSEFSAFVKEQPIPRRHRKTQRAQVKLQLASPLWQQENGFPDHLDRESESGGWMPYFFSDREGSKASAASPRRQVDLWMSNPGFITDPKEPKWAFESRARLILPTAARSSPSARVSPPLAAQDWPGALEKRLAALREAGQEEGISYSSVSEQQLRAFLKSGLPFRMPAVFLLGNGNLRAVWENASGEQVGLQFQPEDEVQFVLFARRRHDRLSHSAGRDTQEGVIDQIRAMRLMRLVSA